MKRDRPAAIILQAEIRSQQLASAHPIWTADALPTEEQLKHFDKPATVVAAFRLMAGIPADPRIPSANLGFHVNKDDIIFDFLNVVDTVPVSQLAESVG